MLEDVQKELISSIAKAHDALRRDLAKLRAGRASPQLLDAIRVDYYGTSTPLAKMANISVPEPRLLTVKPWDKSQMKATEKAIRESDLGLNPQTDGDIIRIPLPPLTEERRKELIKVCKKHGEEVKVQIRGFRRDGNEELKKLQKDTKLTEDELRKSEAEIQKLTDQYVQKIDDVMKKKEGEILEV